MKIIKKLFFQKARSRYEVYGTKKNACPQRGKRYIPIHYLDQVIGYIPMEKTYGFQAA